MCNYIWCDTVAWNFGLLYVFQKMYSYKFKTLINYVYTVLIDEFLPLFWLNHNSITVKCLIFLGKKIKPSDFVRLFRSQLYTIMIVLPRPEQMVVRWSKVHVKQWIKAYLSIIFNFGNQFANSREAVIVWPGSSSSG